jgi:hypothetical protein
MIGGRRFYGWWFSNSTYPTKTDYFRPVRTNEQFDAKYIDWTRAPQNGRSKLASGPCPPRDMDAATDVQDDNKKVLGVAHSFASGHVFGWRYLRFPSVLASRSLHN